MQILGLTTAELQRFCVELGEPAYRGQQLAEWIYRKGTSDFSSMTNLPSTFRSKLNESSSIYRSSVAATEASRDGTTKFVLGMADGERVESVLLPYEDRLTVCISTQVGCVAGCEFCATATGGFVRNLTAGEMTDQVLTLQNQADRRVSNVVFMGMGEPLLNYDETLKSVHLLNAEVGIAMRKITLSTVGITPRIRTLSKEKLQIKLAVSLHAPNDELRRQLIPFAARYPLAPLLATCREYAETTGRRVTYEYLLLSGVNDSPKYAVALAKLLKGSLASVNLIPYNRVPGKSFKRSATADIVAFREALEDNGIDVSQRYEKGGAVAGACGQLKAHTSKKKDDTINL